MVSLESLWAYIPQDRRAAIAAGRGLPDQTHGTALWADLSGFTPLTEALIRKFGARHGADELGLYLSYFYNALIAPVDDYGGSVIDFSGDAITCWFDADDGLRAIAAAQAMQVAIQPFASLQLARGESRISLGVKIAVASGPVRRFQLGDPSIQYLDTLAGAVTDRLAGIGHLARTGELLLDEAIIDQLRQVLQIRAWRTNPKTGQRAAILDNLNVQVAPAPAYISHNPLTQEQIRPWLLPAVFAQIQSGQGEFLTELGPAAALFMRFEGLNYDNDDQIGAKLDAFIRSVQRILFQYDGALLQLTIGDKGSYLYAAFGAPLTHEDDAIRAVAAALELRLLPGAAADIHSVSIGISQGIMRTGGYGGKTRRTYGALGDDANLAARLMELAAPGQILASEAIWEAAADNFDWQTLPSLDVKGKQKTVTPALLLGRKQQEIGDLTKMTVGSPMIGRKAELALVEEKLGLARAGQGQIVSIVGEAGIGKSRLLAEILQRVGDLPCHGGECQSYGSHTSYLLWQPIWRALFGVNPASPVSEQIQTIEASLQNISPDLTLRLPLLGAVVNLPIPDNSLTTGMDAKARKTSRESLLVDCLRAWAEQHPLIFILEDVHWIDPLSADLLMFMARVIKDLPVLILLAHRPFAGAESTSFVPGLANLEYAVTLNIVELVEEEIGNLVAARLTYLGLGGETSPGLVQRVAGRAQGNPFYIEELLSYLHDLGLDPRQDEVWERADLPESLHSLILSRIDQLSQQQQITIKAASILGRLFQAAWLYGYYPPLGSPDQVFAHLDALSRSDLVVQEKADSHLAYLFKHVITQEVAYESLSYATRANLHEQFAAYLEEISGDDVQPYLDMLAYHYEFSNNLPKKREYLRKAGEAARAAFANEAALSYLGKALMLAPEMDYTERFAILAEREQILNILGKREAQVQDLKELSSIAEALGNNEHRAQVAVNQSRYARATNDYNETIIAAKQAVELAHLAGAHEHEARGYWLWGEALFFQGNNTEARTRYEQGLVVAQAAKLSSLTANILMGFGSLDTNLSNYDSAQDYLERALKLQHEVGDRISENLILSCMGDNAFLRGDFVKAQSYYEKTLDTWRSIGYKQSEGRTLSRLASLIIQQVSDYEKAQLYSLQALPLAQDVGDRIGEMVAFYNLSDINLARNHYLTARMHTEQALRICREISYRYYEAGCFTQLGTLADELGEYALALEQHQQGVSILRELGERDVLSQIVVAVGVVYYHLGQYEAATENCEQALSIVLEIKNDLGQMRVLTLQGHLQRELGQLDQAADSYQQALDWALKLGMPQFVKQAQTGLALIALAQGKLADAQAPLNDILNYLETSSPSTRDDVLWTYLTCYRILQASADPRARPTLEAAYRLLQAMAAGIDDEPLQASFLQNVRFNREVIEAWESLPAE